MTLHLLQRTLFVAGPSNPTTFSAAPTDHGIRLTVHIHRGPDTYSTVYERLTPGETMDVIAVYLSGATVLSED